MAGCELMGLKQPVFYIIWGEMIATVFFILKFLSESINQISNYLGIYCFSL